jgi:two-component system, LytTR family, response regulator
MNVVIVEDEYAARERMKELVAEHPDVELLGEAATGPEAVDMISRLRPDVVLLDVSLPQLNGFEVLARVDLSPLPLTIFTTAYDRFAIRAFEIHALDYLLKPVERPRLAVALSRARTMMDAPERDDSGLRRLVVASAGTVSRLTVRTANQVLVLDPDEIEWIEAVGNYAKLHGPNGAVLVRHTLAYLDAQLKNQGFLRIHRSSIVNTKKVTAIVRDAKEVYSVLLPRNTRVRIGDRFKPAVEQLFGMLW